MSEQPKDGGPAFPSGTISHNGDICFGEYGMSLRDWFATFAPRPSDEKMRLERLRDRNRNPHNEAHKPRIREDAEIVADLAFEHAEAMLKARQS